MPSKARISGGRSSQDSLIIPNRYETQIDLPPGQYDIRVVLSDREKFGREQMPLTVDSYDGKQLAISEIALSRRIREVSDESPEAPGRVPGSYVPLVSKGIEITPTADMRFKKDEPLYAYFEVYEPQFAGQSATMVEAHLRILDANTGDVRISFEPVNAAPYIRAGSSVIGIGREINLASLSNGSYRLEVQTTNSTGNSTAWRTANFTIE